jgi:tripartite-type tricarboxylate transporter receptor subunit TctC
VYIPYKGGAQAIADVAGGQADVTLTECWQLIRWSRAEKRKILAVSSAKRMSAIPDVPTISESGVPNFESGLVARRHRTRRYAARSGRQAQR